MFVIVRPYLRDVLARIADHPIKRMRSLIDRIVLTPNEAKSALCIDFFGDLARIVSIAMDLEEPIAVNDITAEWVKLVAEEGLEPPTRGL